MTPEMQHNSLQPALRKTADLSNTERRRRILVTGNSRPKGRSVQTPPPRQEGIEYYMLGNLASGETCG